MTYDPLHTANFYDAYGLFEWQRLEATAYGRLQGLMHIELLQRHVKSSDRLLDAGSGPGRLSIAAASLGAQVTVLDISLEQLRIAKEKIAAAGLPVADFLQGDVADLAELASNSFDVTLCFGGALSYACERRYQAAAELVRVTKPQGIILVSVMSRYGLPLGIVHNANPAMFDNPGPLDYWKVIQTGDLAGVPSRRVDMPHPTMHAYSAAELRELFNTCEVLETLGSNVIAHEGVAAFEELANEPARWSRLVELERTLNHVPGLVDQGSHIMIGLRKP